MDFAQDISIPRLLLARRSVLLLLGAGACNLKAQTIAVTSIDLFPPFFQFWKESNGLTQNARAERFLAMVIQPHLDLFEGFTGPISAERATRYLSQVEPLVPSIDALHSWVTKEFDKKTAAFQKELPDFQWRGSVVFMPNLFVFNAGGGSIAGKDFLVFGLDTIARIDGPYADLSVLITHELFHVYHGSLHPEWGGQSRGNNIPLYRLVWGEGLATYASQQLNPQADVATILGSPTLASSCEKLLKPLARLLVENLDASEKTPFMEWMSGQVRSSDVPVRAGYYFGWRVATALGRQRSLGVLARLPDDEVRNAMAQELQRI
jgi:hypothetical protein